MARSRNIKPGFYKNEDLADCSVWARFIFPGLWMMADREGLLEDRPRRLKAELLPFDEQPVEPLLDELARKKLILRYQNDAGAFIFICNFKKHQSPHYTEKESVIKPPYPLEHPAVTQTSDRGQEPEDSGNLTTIKSAGKPSDLLNPDSPNHESFQVRVEANLIGSQNASPPNTRPLTNTLPLRDGSNFEIPHPLLAELESIYPAVDVPQTIAEMKGWLLGNPTRRKTRAGIRRFITSWLQREQEKHGG